MANDEIKLKFEYGNLKNILELFSNYRLMPIKLGAHETILVRPIFIDRPNRYVCGINFYAILVGRLISGNFKLF